MKIIFISLGYLYTGAIIHGVIVAIPTTLIGILSIIELKKWNSTILHKIIILLPILAIIITPIYMYVKRGGEQWLTEGRLPVLIIYEIFSAIQIIISIFLYSKMKKS